MEGRGAKKENERSGKLRKKLHHDGKNLFASKYNAFFFFATWVVCVGMRPVPFGAFRRATWGFLFAHHVQILGRWLFARVLYGAI